MSQIHIHAEPGEVAPYVLLPGDPKRARFIAENFFDKPEMYSDHRGLLGFTGTYKGVPVSVQTTGMGCPTTAIVVEELIRLGAKTLVRVGTAGVINREVEPGDLIVATGSVPNDGTTRQYLNGATYAPVPDHSVVSALTAAAAQEDRNMHVGLIQTEDAFYATTPEHVADLEARGVLGIEMEASVLFLLGKLRGVRTGCALVASNRIGDSQLVAQEVLQAGISSMTGVALEAAVSLHS